MASVFPIQSSHNHYRQGVLLGPGMDGSDEHLKRGILQQVSWYQLLRLKTKMAKVSFLGTIISLWFTVQIYKLRNFTGIMFLMMSDILRLSACYVFLSSCSPQMPSSPFFPWIVQYSVSLCKTLCRTSTSI